MSREARALAAIGAVAGVSALVHRLARRSGVTTEEARRSLPGDEIVARPLWVSTRGITIDAPPSAVWPWIVQMGYPTFRAGWYTPHWLDELMWGERPRSADTIVPELQDLKVGDKVPDSADFRMYYTVDGDRDRQPPRAALDEPRRARRCTASISAGPSCSCPCRRSALGLYVRARVAYTPVWAFPLVEAVVGLGDFVNVAVMLRGIRERAERTSTGAPGAS